MNITHKIKVGLLAAATVAGSLVATSAAAQPASATHYNYRTVPHSTRCTTGAVRRCAWLVVGWSPDNKFRIQARGSIASRRGYWIDDRSVSLQRSQCSPTRCTWRTVAGRGDYGDWRYDGKDTVITHSVPLRRGETYRALSRSSWKDYQKAPTSNDSVASRAFQS